MEKAYFAAGCFWGVEAIFRKLEGVSETAVGYMGGKSDNPTYEEVCTDRTGHAEAVEVVYDPEKISYDELLDVFWNNHNPTTLNRQGPDVGAQYRSGIYTTSEQQAEAAQRSKAALEAEGKFRSMIVTEIEPAPKFYKAEDYHQQYFEKRGIDHCGI